METENPSPAVAKIAAQEEANAVTPHDRIHHLLFSHREVVEDLLRHIVRQMEFARGGEWIDELDWSTLEREPEVSTASRLDRKYRDIVWSVHWRGSPLYLILLIEFQSQPDRFMALRHLSYLSLFYEDLVKSGRVGPKDKLPPALPICLYNGIRPWHGPERFEHLIATCPRELRPFQPRFSYLLIHELKVPVDLERGERNAAGGLFASQQAKSHEQLLAVVAALERWLSPEEYQYLRRDVATFLEYTLPQELLDRILLHPEDYRMSPKQSLARELKTMVAQGRTEGRIEGRTEGRIEGRIEGQRSLLAKQLRLKFGVLPSAIDHKLAAADAAELEIWAGRVLTAATLDEVWESSSLAEEGR